ncbi:amino acid ABC transporter permease [Suttonella ornithocola]|uniref:Inner membrane amino-acid ABC transporter permease protein yhdY n=1 Tax=Suttonella ornithocola TaxID=279832 RepID=A0A380MWU1_9GAMM|nr:amino acid ABC transporter permease [Suttonella ornithocola]SUO96373.1 Inner membrane amino-acid ABC transporter permease protein yhdY [Suttonella ornithocola]
MQTYLPDRLPPSGSTGFIAWLHKRLFSSIGNTLLTLLGFLFLWWIIPPFLNWAVFHATWHADNSAQCQTGGACWAFIRSRFAQFMYGFYPDELRWRVNLVFLLIVPAFLLTVLFTKGKARGWAVLAAMLIMPIISWILLRGGLFGLTSVPTAKWGGMMLTLVVSSAGILFSLPLGILLALGRVSDIPIIRWICIAFIEIWRGVPLITILFMANIMLPLFLPTGMTIDNLIRALIGVALFASSYMAEVVRGGLQGLPKGQYEATDSLGLSYWAKMRLVILPQALRIVIPAITNTYVGLFKETTLVSIIGLYDFLGIVHSASQDPQWLGRGMEGYAFCAIVYFIICYGMTRFSYRVEKHYQTTHNA